MESDAHRRSLGVLTLDLASSLVQLSPQKVTVVLFRTRLPTIMVKAMRESIFRVSKQPSITEHDQRLYSSQIIAGDSTE